MNEKRSDETGGVPPTTISDELVEIAAKAIDAARSQWPGIAEELARAVVAAAVPYIEAGLREQIAAEIAETIEARLRIKPEDDDMSQSWRRGWAAAARSAVVIARVARGTQEATK